jgi:hypothetical protein
MAGTGCPGANCSQVRLPSSKTCKGATARSPESRHAKLYRDPEALDSAPEAGTGHGQAGKSAHADNISAKSKASSVLTIAGTRK